MQIQRALLKIWPNYLGILATLLIKNAGCATRIHNKVSEALSDRKFYLINFILFK
jgi:hypothetical protein